MAKKKVTITEVNPKKRTTKTPFKSGNIVIPVGFKLSRAKFDRMFKGKISVDIEKLWGDYQSHIK